MTDFILKIIDMIGNQLIFNLFADITLGIDIVKNIDTYLIAFLDFLGKVNFMIPLPDMFLCLGAIVTLKVLKFLLFIANWIIRRIFDVIP